MIATASRAVFVAVPEFTIQLITTREICIRQFLLKNISGSDKKSDLFAHI